MKISAISQFFRSFDFDSSTIGFLGEFQKNSLLSNVNLDFNRCNAEDVLAFLTKILPMITSINSIEALGRTSTNSLLGLLVNKFSSLSKTMLTSARVLNTWSAFSTKKLQIMMNLQA
jgi:hypothetical protein